MCPSTCIWLLCTAWFLFANHNTVTHSSEYDIPVTHWFCFIGCASLSHLRMWRYKILCRLWWTLYLPLRVSKSLDLYYKFGIMKSLDVCYQWEAANLKLRLQLALSRLLYYFWCMNGKWTVWSCALCQQFCKLYSFEWLIHCRPIKKVLQILF